MKLAILGATGMLGHMMTSYYLHRGYNVTTFGRHVNDTFLDAEDLIGAKKVLTQEPFDFIINCIGILVKESSDNPRKAFMVNSVFPKFLEMTFKDTKTKIIQISTDCVFNGKKGQYTENCTPDAEDVYGISKALGEIDNQKDLTIRVSIIGPEIRKNKTGLYEWYAAQEDTVTGYKDALWNGVTTLQLSKTIEEYLYNPSIRGIWQPSSNSISKYQLLKLFKDTEVGIAPIKEGNGLYPVDKTLKSTKRFFTKVPQLYYQLLELQYYNSLGMKYFI